MLRYAIKTNMIDVPTSRSSHNEPTPRGGGVSIVLAFFLSICLLSSAGSLSLWDAGIFLICGSAVAAIGFLDDRRPVRAGVRFGVHMVAAILAVSVIGGISERTLGHWGLHGTWIGAVVAVLLIVWTTNLFNFMDGIDGIAGSEAVFVSAAGACLNWHHGGVPALTAAMLCLAAANLGFLKWNWPPARIFMGDVGSGFNGFVLAVFALTTAKSETVPIETWAMLGGFFFIDATTTLVRRVLQGDPWFESHRTHAYQRLAQRWKAHQPVTMLVWVIDLFWLFPWAWLAADTPSNARCYLAVALVPLIGAAVWLGAGRKIQI
jgi:Fuc2NAc and GlcNAc transferase